LDRQAYIDRLEEEVIRPVREATEAILGKNPRKGRRIPPVIPSARLVELRQQRNELLDKMRRGPLGVPSEEFEELFDVNRKIDVEMTFLRNKGVFKFYRSVDKMGACELSKMLRSIHQLRTRRGGALQAGPEDLEAYRRHFERQYRSPDGNGHGLDREPVQRVDSDPPIITDDSVATWIKWMSAGKAPGRSKISVELLKACLPTVTGPLCLLFNECVRVRTVPSSWRQAMLVPIPKKSNPAGIADHRPISLTEHVRKIFEHVIHPYITDAAEPLNADQCGFRAHRSTLDQAATLNEIVIQFREDNGRAPEMVFLDIKAAYDSIDRRILWRKCLDRGMPVWVVDMLQQLFDHCQSAVVLRNKESGPFGHAAGLMQGSVVSPTLYSIFVDDLADSVDANTSFRVDGRPTGGLFYADDIALIGENREQMSFLLEVCEAHSIVNNYRFNPVKCETFAPADTYRLYDQPLTSTEAFKYLGFAFTEDGINWRTHLRRMIEKAHTAATFFRSVGVNGYGMGERTKLAVYKLFIRSRMEYGLAIMPRDAHLMAMWDKAQNTILRGMFSVGDTAKALPMRVLLHLQDARNRHDELTCRWICASVDKTGEHFLLERAYNEARGRMLRTSCFKFVTSRYNRLLNEIHRQGIFGHQQWKKLYKPVREEYLLGKLEVSRAGCYHPAAMKLAEDIRPRQAYAIGSQSRATRRIITLFLMGRLMGRPNLCARCGLRSATHRHVFECSGLEGAASGFVRGSRWLMARATIVLAVKMCDPEKGAFYDKLIDIG
jgi:hypothetical protein